MIRHIAGFAEVVEDVEVAITFYESLGLEVKRDGDSSDYAAVEVPGVLHFGLWSRGAAAETTYGTRDAADRVPLGFTVGFEVDSVDGMTDALGASTVRAAQTEPWEQRTLRFRTPSGAVCEISETPWARELETNVVAKKVEEANA